MSTENTLNHHLQALNVGIEAILSDYTEKSILFTQEGPVRGLKGIQTFYEKIFNNYPQELVEAIALVRQDIDGDFAYIVWKAEPYINFATDTFVIQENKIIMQTFTNLPPSSE